MSSKQTIRRSFKNGTVRQRTDGYVFVKTAEGWKPKHRLIAALSILDRDLLPNERVVHLDNTLRGEEGFDAKENLVIVRNRISKFLRLKHCKTLYEPKKELTKYKDFVLKG